MALPADKDPSAFAIHRREGLAAEVERCRIGQGFLTPVAELFVCQHHPFPSPGGEVWTFNVVDVNGAVTTLTADRVRLLKESEVTAVLQCSGNGRAFAKHAMKASRVPNWSVGAVGNVRWSGVALRDVLELAEASADGADFLTVTGGDPLPVRQPAGETVVERSVPLDKAVQDGLLAWAVNDRALPVSHGGPLRLVVPGYYGINSVKWVTSLSLTAEETAARMQRSAYRVRPVGVEGSPEHPTMWEMNVKSLISRVAETGRSVGRRLVEVAGVAFSGGDPVVEVEVASDADCAWVSASFEVDPVLPFAWRRFRAGLSVPSGSMTPRLFSRARTQRGQVQPRQAEPNERGYANNGWGDHAIEVLAG